MLRAGTWWCAVALAMAVLAGCGRTDPTTGDGDARTAANAAAARFAAEQQAWRAARHADLTRADGWTSLVGLHAIEPGAHYAGQAADNGIRLAVGPPQLGMLERRGDAVRLFPARGAGVTVDGAQVTATTPLRTDVDPAGPSVIGFDDGKGQASVILRAGTPLLRVRHADAATRTGFIALDYWPADPGWRVAARFVAHPPGTTLPIASITGTISPMANPGAVEFEREGRRHRLEALEAEDGLFLILADRTSGHGSYGAGRYLDAPMPDASGRVMVDFNQAYNPPCAFTPFATCPLPPPGNRLDLAVTAGEKRPAPAH